MTEDANLPALRPYDSDPVRGVARVVVTAAWHTGQWGLKTSVRGWARVGRAATSREEALALLRDVSGYVETAGELARQVADGKPIGAALLEAGEALGGESDRRNRPVREVHSFHPHPCESRLSWEGRKPFSACTFTIEGNEQQSSATRRWTIGCLRTEISGDVRRRVSHVQDPSE